jgi:cytochrome c biogenesis protein
VSGSGAPAAQGRTLLRQAWRTVYSIRTGVILLTAVLVVALLSTIFPQITPANQASQAMEDQWWAAVQERYGILTAVLRTVGAFNVPGSLLFFLLAAALVVSGTACTADRIAPVWRALRATAKAVRPDSFYSNAANKATLAITSKEEGRRKAASVLSRHGYRLTTEEQEGATYLVGDKNRWAMVGTLITHGALVLMALSVLFSTPLAWREPAVILGPGEVYTVGHGHGFQVRHEGFGIDRYDDGTIRNYLSELVVLEDDMEVVRKTISVNDPLIHRGVGFYLSSAGPALRMDAWDAQGQPLAMRSDSASQSSSGELVLNFTGGGKVHIIYLPSLDLRLELSLLDEVASGDSADRPFLYLEAFQGEQTAPLTTTDVSSGESVQVASGTLQFTADTYTVLQAVSDPGFWPVVFSGILGVVGLLISFFFWPSRVWVKLTDAELLVAGSAARNRASFGAQFAKLASELEGQPR